MTGWLAVTCDVSKGRSYVRALARDLAASLGTLGHLTALRRTRSGPFEIEEAMLLDTPGDELAARLIALERAATRVLPATRLTESGTRDARFGRAVRAEDMSASEATGPHAWLDAEGRLGASRGGARARTERGGVGAGVRPERRGDCPLRTIAEATRERPEHDAREAETCRFMNETTVCSSLARHGPRAVILARSSSRGRRSPPTRATATTPTKVRLHFGRHRRAMVPMRDGAKLETVILVPKTRREAPLPILLKRTPYGVPDDDAEYGITGRLRRARRRRLHLRLAEHPRPLRVRGDLRDDRARRATTDDPKAIDESTDAYDTIDWLVRNVPGNSGRVGTRGVSYDGWTSAMSLIDPHPALKCASEQASPSDMFLNDDFHHNGAFRLSYGFEYRRAWGSRRAKDKNTDFDFDQMDT